MPVKNDPNVPFNLLQNCESLKLNTQSKRATGPRFGLFRNSALLPRPERNQVTPRSIRGPTATRRGTPREPRWAHRNLREPKKSSASKDLLPYFQKDSH
jgi:hypothetical protein